MLVGSWVEHHLPPEWTALFPKGPERRWPISGQVPCGSVPCFCHRCPQMGVFPAPGGPQLASSGFQPSASHWPGRTGREPRVSFSVIQLSSSLTLRLPRVIVTFQKSIVLSLYMFRVFSLELEKRKLNSVAQVHWSSKSLSFCRC